MTCDSVDIDDLQPVTHTITIEKKTLLTALFTYVFNPFPIVGEQNSFRMTTEQLYDFSSINTITFKVIDYLGNERTISYTKEDEKYKFTFDEVTYDITLNFLYLSGDYIELIEVKDTINTLTFTQGEHVFIHPCPPLLNLNFDYKCNVSIAKWSTEDISSLTQITFVDPSTNTIIFCTGCANDITFDTENNIANIIVNLPTVNEYKISSIELNSFTYGNINENYPIFITETSLVSAMNDVQFASDETFTTVGDYPSDAYLLINNQLAFPCIVNAENKRQCEISITNTQAKNLTEFKFLYKSIYYQIEETSELVIYEVKPICVNSIDIVDRVTINITTFTDDKFKDYKMYLNADTSYTVDSEQITSKVFIFTFMLQNLHNGLYDSFYLINSVDNFNISSTKLFYYVDNSIVNIIYMNGTTLAQGIADQVVEFEFANDVTYISHIQLTDLDEDMTIGGKFITSQCEKNLNLLTCNFDMSSYYGYDYAISFISTCYNVEFTTNLHTVTEIAPKKLSTTLNYYVANSIITMQILPKVQNDVTSITLEDITDGSIINIAEHKLELKSNLTFASSAINTFKVKVEVDGEVIEYEPITIVEHKIELLYQLIFLPKDLNKILM